MPLFKREPKQSNGEVTTPGKENASVVGESPKHAAKSPRQQQQQQQQSKQTASPAASGDKHNSSRRAVAKPTNKDVSQKVTQVLYRLNYAVKQRPVETNRSSELVPLNREFDDLRKQLKALVQAARKYQQAMDELVTCRSDLLHRTAKLAENSPLQDKIASDKVVLGESFITLDKKLVANHHKAVELYKNTVVDYAVEWEMIVTKKVDSELTYTSKLHKNLKHYEAKLEKLRKTVAAKEEKGKIPSQLQEKLDRNEGKLTSSWKEYEETATRTCHLLEEATRMGWKDLYPLLQAYMTFEHELDQDAHELWSKALPNLQNKVAAVVDAHVQPLPASAFQEVMLISRPNNDDDDQSSASQVDSEGDVDSDAPAKGS